MLQGSPMAANLMTVREGSTELLVPPTEHTKGPKRKEGVPFYNPAMRVARDVSVLVLSELAAAEPQRTWRVCDAMAALGARGLRMANEVPRVKVQLNDANPESIQLAQQNAKRLELANVDFRVGRLESHLAAERYDWVDLDPYGTPAGFLDVATLGIEEDGILAVSATDMATLSGVYPVACQRRYNATPLRGPCMPEIATRILVGAAVRAAGRRDRCATPLLAYATQHFTRAYFRLRGGAREADLAAKHLGFATFASDGNRAMTASVPTLGKWAGPLWTGPLMDATLVSRLSKRATETEGISVEARRLVERWIEEAASPPLYYDVDEITRNTTQSAPPLDTWVERLRAGGHAASRTHFSPRGVKTDADLATARRALGVPSTAAGSSSR